jgi:hypothetical protein
VGPRELSPEFRDTIIVEIHPSARKHGIADDDIVHAVEHALVVADTEDDPDTVLHLGPDRAGNLLEVITVVRLAEPDLVIHAMPMRSSYEPLLRGLGGSDA